MRQGLWLLAAVGALLGSGCFSPVEEPDYWRYRRARQDGGLLLEADGGGGTVEPGSGCPKAGCGSFGDVEDIAGLRRQLATLSWTTVARPTSVCLPASDQFHTTRTINLTAGDLTKPAECGVLGACAGITFELSEKADGVSCLDDFCTTLLLTGAHFRLRQVVYDQYPGVPRYVPIAEILPTCDTDCEDDERRCAAHGTCWAEELDYCRFCEARPQEECACLGKLEGEACLVYRSNDMSCSGTCQDERCVLASGQPNCPEI